MGANIGSLEYVYTYYKKGHQPGVYVPLRALFLVGYTIFMSSIRCSYIFFSVGNAILSNFRG